MVLMFILRILKKYTRKISEHFVSEVFINLFYHKFFVIIINILNY